MESRNLTIMMTDIKGFTVRTSTMSRDQIETLLHEHEQLLSPIFVEFDGNVVKTIGDAFLVTFASATKAIEAGQKIQRTLAAHNARATEERKLLVRVVLNAGEVNIREGDVFGEPVNITARVEGVGEASHVTFTDAVRLLLNQDAVPFEELGEFELKGIPKPVSLFRIVPDWAVVTTSPSVEAPQVKKEEKKETPTQEKKEKPAQKGSGPSGSTPLLPIAVLVVVILCALFFAFKPTGPMSAAKSLAEAGKWQESLAAVQKVLAAAPGNKEAAALQRKCRLALLHKKVEESKWLEAFEQAALLLNQDRNDKEVREKAIDLASKGVAAAIAASDFDNGSLIISRLKKLLPDIKQLKTFRVTLNMASLEKAYEQAMIARAKGPSSALKVFRERKFSSTLKELRRLGHRSAMLDFLESRYLMTQVSAVPPSTWISSSSYSRPDANKAINLYSKALEKDKNLRDKREVADDLINLLKLYDPTQDRDEIGKRLRRTVSNYHAEWIVDKLVAAALEPAKASDGDKAHEATYNLRHNVKSVLDSAGMASRADKVRFTRLDFAWFRKHQSNDSKMRDRLGNLAAEVSFTKSKPLRDEFIELLKELRDRGGLGWFEQYYQNLSVVHEVTEEDDTHLLITKLDHAIDCLKHRFTGKYVPYYANAIKSTLPECGKLKEEKNKKRMLTFFVTYRMRLAEDFKEALPIIDEAIKKLGGKPGDK